MACYTAEGLPCPIHLTSTTAYASPSGLLQFLDALDLVATKKGQPLAEVVAQVAGCAGPEAHGATQGEWVKLHDDRSTYTGERYCCGAAVADGT